jgi:hypothetical protein
MQKKTYKIIKRTFSEDNLSTKAEEEESKCDDSVVLVKVKRFAGQRDDIEELQLEFNKGGSVKRQKLVTQNEVLVRNFNASLKIEKTQVGFCIGVPETKQPVVTLRRLLGCTELEARH